MQKVRISSPYGRIYEINFVYTGVSKNAIGDEKMMKKFEYKGIWWLPDKPEEQIPGTLRFTPDEGAVLDLIGSFKDIKDMNKILEPEIILGVSSNGKNITLHKCFETKSSFSFPGFQTSSFYANLVFIGAHFQKLENIKFKSLFVHYLHLDEWVNISGFDIKHLREKEVVIKYKLPEPFQIDISDGLKILINIRATGPSLSFVQKEATIKQKTEIKIETSEDKSFEYYRKIMYHIQNFLSLGIMEPVYPLTIEGITEVNKEMINDKLYNPPVEIYYKLPDIPKAPKTLHPFDMLFTFKDISDRFEMFLKNWFEKANTLEPVYDLYFGPLYNPRMYLRHQFLSLIQALEAYHRRNFEGKYLPDDDYGRVRKKLEEFIDGLRIDSSFKNALKNKLKYGNEYSLRKRLKEIFRQYKEITDNFITNKDVFINKVVEIRNYLTHYDKNSREIAVDKKQLYHITQQLKIVIVICLLSELGFNFKEIKNLLARNYKYIFNR